MDETVTPEPVHDLLLRLAGRVDDDLLGDARELLAVGEDSRALELVTAALAADGTPLPEALRAGLVAASRSARIDLDVDAALGPVGDVGDDHRFAPGTDTRDIVHAVQQAIGTLPARRLQDCELRMAWRLTPAGTVSGPLPRPVVLVRTGGYGPPDILAFQMATALERGGVHASVEVLADGGPVPRYHAAAWRDSVPIAPLTGDDGGPGGSAGGSGPAAEQDDDTDWDDEPDDRRWSAADGRRGGHDSWDATVPNGRGGDGDGWTNGRSSWSDEHASAGEVPDAGSTVGLFDDDGRQEHTGRRTDTREAGPAGSLAAAPAEDGIVEESRRSATRRPGPAVDPVDDGPRADPGGQEPAPRPLPMRPPGGRRRLVEDPTDTQRVTPLNRGPAQGPVPIDRRRPSPRPTVLPQPVEPTDSSVPRPSRPDPAELTDTPTFAAMQDALLGPGHRPLLDPTEEPDDPEVPAAPETAPAPAHHRGSSPRAASGPGSATGGSAAPAGPGPMSGAGGSAHAAQQTDPGRPAFATGPAAGSRGSQTEAGPRRSGPPRAVSAPAAAVDDERSWAGEWTSGEWAVANPAPAEQNAVAPSSAQQAAGLLRPETVTRLSDADRDLLARLQAELVSGRRPRTGHHLEGTGANGTHPDDAQRGRD